MAEMTEQEWQQHLKKEFKSMELEFKKIFSEMHEEILTLKARWSRPRPDPKGSTNKVFSSSNLVKSAIQNFPKFDGSDPKLWIRKCDRAFLLHPVPQDQKVLVASSQFEKEAKIWYQLVYARRVGVTWREFSEAVLDRFFNEKQEVVVYESREEFKPPVPIIVTNPAKIQEASVDAKGNTQSDPNQNPYTPPINPPNRNPFSQTFNLNTDIPKPNTLPNTNPNTKTAQSGHLKMLPEEKKHSNTFQTLTNPNQKFTEPIPIKRLTPTETRRDHTHNLHGLTITTVSNRGSVQTSEFWPQLTKPPIRTFPNPRFMDTNKPNPWPNKLPKLTYLIRPKPWPDEPPLLTVPKPRTSTKATQTTEDLSQNVQQTKRRVAYQPQLRTSSVAIQALNRFQNRVFAVAQIRVTVIAILRHLPEFDPGDHRLKGGEERLDFDFDGVFAIFDRVWDQESQEERDYGLLKIIDEIWESILAISKKKKLGFIVCHFWAFENWGFTLWNFGCRREGLGILERESKIKGSRGDFEYYFLGKSVLVGQRRRRCSDFQSSYVELKREAARVVSEPKSDFIGLSLKPITGSLLGSGRIGSSTSWGKLGNNCNYQILQLWQTGSAPDLGQLGHLQLISISFPFPLGHICN